MSIVHVAKPDVTCDIMPSVVRTLHVAKPNKVHATLNSGVVCIVHVAKPDVVNTTIRHCARSYDIRLFVVLTVHVVKPDDIRLCRETRWRLYDTPVSYTHLTLPTNREV